MLRRLIVGLGLLLVAGVPLRAQPGVANRCVLWGAVRLGDGSQTYRFAPEPIPAGPHYLHYIVTLNGDESRILTELAPKWSPSEDVNIPGNSYFGCELGNFAEPAARPGDTVQVLVTDEAAGQQGVGETTVPELPAAIHLDVQLAKAEVTVPELVLRDGELHWDEAAEVTLVYARHREDRHPDGRPRGQYSLVQRLEDGETTYRPEDAESRGWMIVRKGRDGEFWGRSREARSFQEADGYESLIAVARSGRIYTLDVGAGRVTVRSPGGEPVGGFDLAAGLTAAGMECDGEKLIVLDSAGQRLTYSTDGRMLNSDAWEAPDAAPVPGSVAMPRGSVPFGRGKTLVVDGLAKKLVEMKGTRVLRTFEGKAFGGFKRPRALAQAADGSVYVLDGAGIVIVPAALAEELPESRTVNGRLTLAWTTGAPVATRATVTGQGLKIPVDGGGKPTRNHRVVVEGIEHPGKYQVTVSHSIRVLGEEPSWASTPLLVPPDRPGHAPYLKVKLAMIVWANAGQMSELPEGVKWPGPISDEEVERLKREMRVGELFYWLNSGLRFHTEMDFIVDAELRDVPPFSAGFRPTREHTAPLLEAHGRSIDDYDGVCRIIAEQAYDANAKAWRPAGRGGGFTSGVAEGSKDPGWSWWRACDGRYFIPDSWLFTHEYGHQVDAMFHASGEFSFWGNHFAPQEKNVARFGEHFDGNAYICRWWPPEKWLTSDWGRVEFAVDADEDGVPDDAPELPLDEKRMGSDPKKKDTDGDGLPDLQEAMAWNGVHQGLGQVWAAPVMPDPTSRDTDGDGKSDGADPHPLYPFPEAVLRQTVAEEDLPGALLDGPFTHEFGAHGLRAETWLAWDEERLYVGCRLSEPQPVLIQLDAENDGWFVNRDNYHITVQPSAEPGAPPGVRVFVVNAAEPGKWPFNDQELVKPEDIECWVDDEEGYALVVAIPRSGATGLLLERGERLGLIVGYGHPGWRGMYLTLSEPHDLVEVYLEE